jgi:hypothetical protein
MNGTVDGPLNALNVSTHRHVRRTPIFIDGVFQSDSFMAMLKKNCVVPFPGGRTIAGNITFDTLLGGAYDIGQDFDLSEQKTDEQMQFFPRYLQANVTTSLEMLEVLNTGNAAMYSDVHSKLRNGYNSIGSWLAISAYLKNVTSGYSKLITGITEAISDGSTNNWDGATYANYGGLTRSSYYGALTSYVDTLGGEPIEYDDAADALEECSWADGEMEPNVFLTSPRGFTSFKKRYQIQQQLNESTPVIGFKGFSIENATVLKSRYCPGQDIATSGKKSNRVATRFLSTTTKGAVTTYPSVTNESAFILNLRKPNIHLHVSTSDRYQFGFTGWKIAANNTKISGQILWSGQLTVDNPSFFGHLYNFV